jgi:hypothetical protein
VTANGHPLALRTPWYVLERASPPVLPTDAAAGRPALQKYDAPEFVRQLIADPRQSLKFHDKEDVWSFPVPLAAFRPGATGRQRFATSRLVHTSMRKLYQSSHDRFYALTIELFCDGPGLPRPGEVSGVDLRFVVRRERVEVSKDKAAAARKLALELALQLDAEAGHPDTPAPLRDTDDADDMLWVERTEGRSFTKAQLDTITAIAPKRIVEAWTVDASGRGTWTRVTDETTPALLDSEQEHPMWRLPPRAGDCTPARKRSLWFGVVPTFSGDIDTATALPKLDDRSVYRILCFARQQQGPGCPPRLFWSSPTAAYRLASFYDAQGTKNRRVSITMPDFRTLSARAGEPQGPGGVEIVRPPGSQLKFDPDLGTPSSANTDDFGAGTSRCIFAIELLMIVAMFLFSLFLPVVVFLFQLWWLLLLRFCFPRPDLAIQVLTTYFGSGGTLLGLDQTAVPANDADGVPRPDLDMVDELLDATRAGARLEDNALSGFPIGAAVTKDLITSLDPAAAASKPTRTPEPAPSDPLCDRGLQQAGP